MDHSRESAPRLTDPPINHPTTQILPIHASKIGQFIFSDPAHSFLLDWHIELSTISTDATTILAAANLLRHTSIPIAFPTETVYGLAADATRSSAVRGIFAAKQRPSDNPLIVHISSLNQLRNLLLPPSQPYDPNTSPDPIPPIYHSLISRFWPGPISILLPNPTPSHLAPEVTASLSTFAARMPSSLLALALIHLSNTPIAAPSANASTKPSPTTAAHVAHDLSGCIDLILDGGPCTVGLESTVVDGLVDPPAILRPGGISIEDIKQCEGWEGVVVGYKDGAEGGAAPRAPGMKYKHYSPRAKVVLVMGELKAAALISHAMLAEGARIGVIRTKIWKYKALASALGYHVTKEFPINANGTGTERDSEDILLPETLTPFLVPEARRYQIQLPPTSPLDSTSAISIWDIGLGSDTADIARGLFAALRQLDQAVVDVIFVEGIDDDGEGGVAAAVMNRLRKAAEVEV
ncbi:hypothetical protein MMC12_005459 [Toensbergia leucococca]|nr:hypothetical protein [Toensbergia leucococca]